jgi:hypothetical protein
MSRPIRFLTDSGYENLISDLLSRYPFLEKEESSNHKFVYLTFSGIKLVYFARDDKRVTFSELGFIITFKNNTEYSEPTAGHLEDILMRKTLIKRLDDTQTLITKYYYGK